MGLAGRVELEKHTCTGPGLRLHQPKNRRSVQPHANFEQPTCAGPATSYVLRLILALGERLMSDHRPALRAAKQQAGRWELGATRREWTDWWVTTRCRPPLLQRLATPSPAHLAR